MKSQSNIRAFSFTEALVVVVSIMILTGITVASFSRAKEYARITRCLSNLHRLSMAALQYAQNNQGAYPCDDRANQSCWYSEVAAYNSDIAANSLCPDAKEPSGGVGTAFKAWGGPKFGASKLSVKFPWVMSAASSYGLNGDMIQHNGWDQKLMGREHVPAANGAVTSSTPDVTPSEPLFVDAIWVDGAPQRSDAVPQSLRFGDANLSKDDQMGIFCINRHFGRVNVSFADGSGFTIPLAQLWQLKWNADYHPRNVVVPVTW